MTQYTQEQIASALQTVEDQLAEATSSYQTERERLQKQAAKLKTWLWDNGEHTADGIIGQFVQLRDARSAIKADYEAQDRILKLEMECREAWLLDTLNTIGASSLKGSAGTAYVTEQTRSNCGDWPLFWQYIKDNNRFDLLEKRVSQKPIRDMIEAGDDLPPAISTFTERVVTIRRS